jgi:hypothetical protein
VSGTKNPVVSAAPLSIEEVQKKMTVILEEFLYNSNYKVFACVQLVLQCGHKLSMLYFTRNVSEGALSSDGDITVVISRRQLEISLKILGFN